MDRNELTDYLNRYLRIDEIEDYGPQGLQVDSGNRTIERVALAVDTAPAAIQAAAAWRADMLLVHHGILWGDVKPLTGPIGRRVRLLIQNGINLYAAHLPLDAHPEVGNNAVLAQILGLEVTGWWCTPKGTPIGVVGKFNEPVSLESVVKRAEAELKTAANVLKEGPEMVEKVAILSGFGADDVKEAKSVGADTYLTGETSHSQYWAAADYKMNVIYAGHYATETVGVKALGRHLEREFGLEVRFFDFPTGL
ncbi:MAG: Nif3-like dinuclear metal center hexameric protein [Anaerolineae bacterium]|nr:MAG: Nif3-like dinuclear metal center hexameric protein [Anaerolineae bacterium]